MKRCLEILRHTIGEDKYGNRRGDRNYFVTNDCGQDFNLCVLASQNGLMNERIGYAGSDLIGGQSSKLFFVTKEGFEFVNTNTEKQKPLTRSQARYRRYLEMSECFDSFMSFVRYDSIKKGFTGYCKN